MNWLLDRIKGDSVIWVIIFLLSLISMLAVYSTTKSLALATGKSTEYYVLTHLMQLGLGLVVLYFAHKIDFRLYSGISKILLPLAIVLMIVTNIAGVEINDARRWLKVPVIGLQFQTSDLAKLALIMFLSRTIARKQSIIEDFKNGFLPLMLPVVAMCLLIAPSDLSTAAMLFAVCVLLLFIGRAKLKHIGYLIGAGIVGLTLFITVMLAIGERMRIDTWLSRWQQFVSEEVETDQNKHAKMAIASGEVFGKGPGQSDQRSFLPNPYADFIFAIIVEEYGFVGALFLICLYLLFLHRSIRILFKSPNSFGALLAVGLTLLIVFQAFINMGVAVNLFPVTGLTLPLVSKGGTSILFTTFAVGIILSVSARVEEGKDLNPKNSPVAAG